MRRLQRGEGYLWAPGRGVLDRVTFPPIRTFDSSRTPKSGERLATPRTLAEVDLSAIVAALAAETDGPQKPDRDQRPQSVLDRRHLAQLEEQLAIATARAASLDRENRELKSRLADIAALAAGSTSAPIEPAPPRQQQSRPQSELKQPRATQPVTTDTPSGSPDALHPAAHELLSAAARHAPARFTWGQLATLAGLKPSGGHFNAGCKDLHALSYVAESLAW